MLPFNPEFHTGESKITQIRLTVRLKDNTILHLTEENVLLGGFNRDSSTTVDGVFTIGAAVTGKLTVSLDNSDNSLSSYDYRGAVITASLGGQLSDESEQLVQVGIYTVDGYTYDGSNITLTAYDNFCKFDKPCNANSITFPQTIAQLVNMACAVAGVSLANTAIPNGAFSIPKQPEPWDTMTWHDVISYCAQMACCFAIILPNGKLFFSWYDAEIFNTLALDGGSFYTETIPYSDGDTASGGDFTYSDTGVISGGVFGDRNDYHIISSYFDLSIDTDDVLITGVTVSLDPINNIDATSTTKEYIAALGTTDYAIRIVNNPLIETTTAANSICSLIYSQIKGMRFRPLDASVLEDPSIEAGDVGVIIDRYNNTHRFFVSHVNYTTGAPSAISCDAASSLLNLGSRYSESQKARALTQRSFGKAVTDANTAMQMIVNGYATTMGLYRFEQSDGQGGTYYIYGNKPSLPQSDIRWRFAAGAFMVSSDYGRTWNAAISVDGTAVFQQIYAVKVNADNIIAGTIRGRAIQGGSITGSNIVLGGSGNGTGSMIIRDGSNNELVNLSKNGASIKGSIKSGSSIQGSSINGGTIKGSSIEIGGSNQTGSLVIKDASNNELVRMDRSGASIKGSIKSGSSIQGSSISGGTINGSSIVIGGSNQAGSLVIRDGSNNELVRMDRSGASIKGTIKSGSSITGSSILVGGNVYGSIVVKDQNNNNVVEMSGNGVSVKGSIKGGSVIEGSTVYGSSILSITDGTGERGAVRIKNGRLLIFRGNYTNEQLYNLDWSDAWGGIAAQYITAYKEKEEDPDYLYGINFTTPKDIILFGKKVDADSNTASLIINTSAHKIWDGAAYGASVYIPGSFTVKGQKNRLVDTNNYGSVRMNAFETAGSHFADIGSGTVGEDGTVTIFFDPVFEETIEAKADYHVFLTRTSEAETTWVDKQAGYFIVHGEPGATFDWMIVGYQKEYVLNRMETGCDLKPVNHGPIVEEDTSAFDAVEQMVAQYKESLEDIT